MPPSALRGLPRAEPEEGAAQGRTGGRGCPCTAWLCSVQHPCGSAVGLSACPCPWGSSAAGPAQWQFRSGLRVGLKIFCCPALQEVVPGKILDLQYMWQWRKQLKFQVLPSCFNLVSNNPSSLAILLSWWWPPSLRVLWCCSICVWAALSLKLTIWQSNCMSSDYTFFFCCC